MARHVYHYTSLDALVGILKKEDRRVVSNKDNLSSLTFWGSRYDCMNDPQDYLFASKVVMPKVIKALEGQEDITEDLKENIEMYPYIVSFSENRDDESMWKHYQAEVCLELDSQYFSPWLKENDVIKGFWGKCHYANESKILDVFPKVSQDSMQYIENIPSMARHACVFIKRDAFRREQEWRLYMADECNFHFRANGSFSRMEQPQDIKVRQANKKGIVFYKEFKIDAKALTGIVVNDTDVEHFHKIKKQLEVLLRSRGFYPEDISIEQTSRYPLTRF
jgi:Protein of unknown function (DUF2971).